MGWLLIASWIGGRSVAPANVPEPASAVAQEAAAGSAAVPETAPADQDRDKDGQA